MLYFTGIHIGFGFIIILFSGGLLFPYFLGILIAQLGKFLDNNVDRKL